MSKIIEAKAVISAADATGNVFDRLAQKIKGVEKSAQSLGNIKPPKFSGSFDEEIARLKLTEKQLEQMRANMRAHMDALKTAGPMRPTHYFRSISDWQAKEVQHWRGVKVAAEEAAIAAARYQERRNRIFGAAGGAMLRGAAMLGGGYAVARAGRAGMKAAGEGQRETARDYLAGLDEQDTRRIDAAARSSSSRFQSVDSSTMHERLRDTAMSMRSTDKAIELADTIAQGTTVLQSLKGKDKAIEEGRKFFSALDVMGKNLDPKEVKELFDGYIKALGVEGADMDLGGVLQFARQSRAAGGILSNRFLMTTMPGLARDLGDAQLGTSLSSALNQNIGGRATKASQQAQRELGIRDDKGFRESRLAMSDPDRYAWEVLAPALQKKGVNVDDDLAVTQALTKVFSNRTVVDVFTKLINQREQYQGKAAQYARAPGLAAAGPLMAKDPFVAYEALFAQLRTLASQAPVMDAAAASLNSLSGAISNLNKFIETGKVPEDSRGGRWLKTFDGIDAWKERERIGNLEAQEREADQKIRVFGLKGKDLEAMRLKDFELRSGIDAARNRMSMPGLGYDDPENVKRWADDEDERRRERNRGRYGGRADAIPTPSPRPDTTGGMPPVQPMEGAPTRVEGEIKGEVESKITVEAGSELLRIVENMKQLAIEVRGKLSSIGGNGPGSTGKSSPDAAAPIGHDTGLSGGL